MPIWEKPSLLREKEGERGSSPLVRVTLREGTDQTTSDSLNRRVEAHYRIVRAMDETRQKIKDEIAKGKTLDEYSRRGAEGSASYLARRDAGLPPKNEWDDPNSPYHRDKIEDGLMMRENNRGVEYGIMLDKHGEVITVAKGVKGAVSYALSREIVDAVKGGELSHNHPTQNSRPLGGNFSAGDIKCHGNLQLEKLRAVAVEGTYVMTGQQSIGNRISTEVVADMNNNNKIRIVQAVQSKMHEINKRLATEGKPPRFSYREIDDAFYGEHYTAVSTAMQKETLTRSGYGYSFKAKKGFEHLQEVADRPIKNVDDTITQVFNDNRFRTGEQLKTVLTRKNPAFKPTAKIPFDRNGDTEHLKTPPAKPVTAIPATQPKPAPIPKTIPTATPPKPVPATPAKPPRAVKPPKPIKEKPTDPKPSFKPTRSRDAEDLRFQTVIVPTNS
jgi:hypothetical protein